MIDAFTADLPVRIRFGDGVIGELGETLAGRRTVAIVEEPVLEIPAVARAVMEVDVFPKPPGEPSLAEVAEAAAAVADRNPQMVVGIGGGSALDLAKAARLVASQGVSLERFLGGATVEPPRIDLILVPTTSGTGSEVSGGIVVTQHGRKVGVADPLLRAQDALVDPLLTVGLPPEATAQTGMDALAQAIGGVIVRPATPPSVATGLEACRHLAAGLVPAVRNGEDLDARRRVALGSLLAGLSMNLSDTGADHALGHALGAVCGLPHGLSVGLVLAETLEVSRSSCADRLERVADSLGEPAGAPGDGARAVAAVRRLLAATGFPTLRQAGVVEADLDRLVALARDDYCLTVDPMTWGAADIRRAFMLALALDRRTA